MLSRTESIDGFHLKLSRTEKELYEEFLKNEEAEILAEMQQCFVEAKQRAGGIRFDDQSQSTVDAWMANACADKHVRNLMAKTYQGIVGRAMSGRPAAESNRQLRKLLIL